MFNTMGNYRLIAKQNYMNDINDSPEIPALVFPSLKIFYNAPNFVLC